MGNGGSLYYESRLALVGWVRAVPHTLVSDSFSTMVPPYFFVPTLRPTRIGRRTLIDKYKLDATWASRVYIRQVPCWRGSFQTVRTNPLSASRSAHLDLKVDS